MLNQQVRGLKSRILRWSGVVQFLDGQMEHVTVYLPATKTPHQLLGRQEGVLRGVFNTPELVTDPQELAAAQGSAAYALLGDLEEYDFT